MQANTSHTPHYTFSARVLIEQQQVITPQHVIVKKSYRENNFHTQIAHYHSLFLEGVIRLIIHLNILVCLFKDIVILDAVLYPED